MVDSCADLSKVVFTPVDENRDSVFVSGTLNEFQIKVASGVMGYKTRLSDAFAFSTDGPIIDGGTNDAHYIHDFLLYDSAIEQGRSFTGNQKFGFSFNWPCFSDVNDPVEYFNQFQTGQQIGFGGGIDCTKGAFIALEMYCYRFWANGTGRYRGTSFNTENGPQAGSSITIEKINTFRDESGQMFLDFEASFRANFYHINDVGAVVPIGTIDDGAIKILHPLR
ncbi:hypothetical protein [Lewinella sp. W8]|uniref:hypothetical protein n=1 Tax=Lewinella sp. W8 TaxID=2528208 RepID=UPI001067330C|nr:hypothetical protein [Lewinella sp. W8]MTB52221.1 hypothetical protein [Lewinella sp. W8]